MKRWLILLSLSAIAIAQTPFSNVTFPSVVLTASNAIGVVNLAGPEGGQPSGRVPSWTTGNIVVTGSGLTTATFAVGCSVDGKNYNSLPVNVLGTPSATALTETVTSSPTTYQVYLTGCKYIRILTSGTFTATSVIFTLTASPNGIIGRAVTSSSGTVNAATTGQIAVYAADGAAVSGTSALPNGTTATTQSPGDNSTKVATTAYADAAGGGTGTVTKVSVTTANGVSGTVATDTTTPAITLTLGAIAPTSVTIASDSVHSQASVLVSNGSPSLSASSGQGWEAYVGSGATNGLYDLPTALPVTANSYMVFGVGASSHAVGSLRVLSAPTVTVLTTGTAATYTTPAGALYLSVCVKGGGGGGGGSGTTPGAATAGGNTTFGSVTGNGGGAGVLGGTGAVGGTASGGDVPLQGANALPAGSGWTYNAGIPGAPGLNSGFGLPGDGTPNPGLAAPANSGGGGGGAGAGAVASPGGGGASGGYTCKIISSPTSTYTYTVGAGGTGGTLGTSGAAGGNGAAGLITATAYFQ
jgi:hypothetical protein